MPRILDRLDAAVGRTPAVLDLPIDYSVQVPAPERLINEDGTYNAGWFPSFDGAFNFGDSSAFNMALFRFFHLTLDAPDHYIVWNIADFSRAGNVAVLVVDKRSGRFESSSITRLVPQNNIVVSEDQRLFMDPETRSFVQLSADDRTLQFSVHAEHLHLTGVAEPAIGPAFVQCTRFHRGRGSLQWYGCMRLRFGTLTIGREVVSLPEGCLGTTDRTVGHQRGLQGWHWIAAAGLAVSERTGRETLLGLQVQRDHPERARPVVHSRKYIVWMDGRVLKLPDAQFEFTLTDPETHASGPWRVFTPDRHGDGLELRFTPRHHRRESRSAWLIDADFNQYYGEVEGRLWIDGEPWLLLPTFAVTEDSRLEM